MADTLTPAAASPAKKAKVSAKKPSHPKTSEMVNHAITELKERGGSSLQAIKKYITANYKVDAVKLAPFIKKYLKGAVEAGALIQTKGKGASGSFKLEASKTSKRPAAKEKKPVAKKLTKTKPIKKVAVKPKKVAVKPKKAAPVARSSPKKAANKPAAKPKTPTKAKKTAKPPTRKPKTPKSKKAAAVPKGRPAAKKPVKK